MNLEPQGLVVHADWSLSPAKRWMAAAVRRNDDTYILQAPEPVGDPLTWLDRLRADTRTGGVFLGLDFPLGLPLSYAARVGVDNFFDLLPRLGSGEWADFYHVAAAPEEISVRRPFYPFRPGRTRQQHLLDGLGVHHIDELRRQCDRGYAGRRPAAPIFWTMGAQQVGKAAIAGWRDVLGPALQARTNVYLWPFAGALDELLSRGGITIAESYPAEFYGHLSLSFPPGRGGKRSRAARAANAAPLLAWAQANPVTLSDELFASIQDGFGEPAAGEDHFDAVVGLFGMLNVLFGHRPPEEPADEQVRRVEGWILGQAYRPG
jgi:hypothetical protein